jgi:hypothetical protein
MSYEQPKTFYDSRLEAVIVCLNYGDFLNESLPMNLSHIDRLVVVTSHDDITTKEVCRKWSVECVVTDVFTEKGETFNKGAAINVGLGALRQKGFVLQMDADIVLPLGFRNMLDKSALQRDCLYGAQRCNVVGYGQWRKLKHGWHDDPQFGYRYLVNSPADYPVGATLVHKQWGYCPIGYFQLWHSQYMRQYELRYPETEGSAENMDVQWAARWPRAKRILLPTVRVFHLESEAVKMGANWQGRTTRPFTPDGEPLKHAPSPNPYGYQASS